MGIAKVLIVDDDPMVRKLVSTRLQHGGIHCDAAESAEQALRLMQENLYFAVVADLHLPGLNGVQMISALKEISPLVQVIVLTSDACVEKVIACADRGAVDFFAKNGDYGQLVEAVRMVLGRRKRWAEWLGNAVWETVSTGDDIG